MAGHVRNQYLASTIVNLASLTFGTWVGWVSPSLPTLKSPDDTPLDAVLSPEEESWIGALLPLGAVVGTFVYGYIADIMGRKLTGYLIAIPYIISWLLIRFATSVPYIYAARTLAGFSGGGTHVLSPMFVAEIAEDRVRGQLASILMLQVHSGIVVSFLIGAAMGYANRPYVMLIIPVTFFITFWFLPETPAFLMKKGKTEQAKESLKWYRGLNSKEDSTELDYEMDKLITSVKSSNPQEQDKINFKDLKSRAFLLGLLISITVLFAQQASGIMAVVSYADNIFKDAGSSMSAEMSGIMVASLQAIGSLASTLLVERTGRKPLLIGSCSGTAFCLLTLGTYLYVQKLGYDVTAVTWIPVVALSSCVFIYACGLGPLAFVIIAELFSSKMRGLATSLCVFFVWFFAFMLLRFFNTMLEYLGMYGSFWFFGGAVISAGVIFPLFVIPETKGRSLESILEDLSGKKGPILRQ